MESSSYQQDERQRRQDANFAHAKAQCLGKRDKSSAGRLDPQAVEICSVVNECQPYYTTSSCAGRCFLYTGGPGSKTNGGFRRMRVSHDLIHQPDRYFNLNTFESDPTGGGDPVRAIGQFEYNERRKQLEQEQDQQNTENGAETSSTRTPQMESSPEESNNNSTTAATSEGDSIWLRFEPFILHVACRSMAAAAALMSAARPAFKNVGLTTWQEAPPQQNGKVSQQQSQKGARYLVAIWGDEGLDMPLTDPTSGGNKKLLFEADWLAALVNERHARNWAKIDRFVQAVRDLQPTTVDAAAMDDDHDDDHHHLNDGMDYPVQKVGSAVTITASGRRIPRSFDVIGDVALLQSLPDGIHSLDEKDALNEIGMAIMNKNKAIKVVAVRASTLVGTERAPIKLVVICGANRSPLITTHGEYGIRCVVDLNHTFFSPRMGPERLRICQQVARGEHVLVLFSGVSMEALQIAGRTEALSVRAVELNPVAVTCARRSHAMLERNKSVQCSAGAAKRLTIVEANVLEDLPTLERNYYDRILAPRPKEGSMDGDLGAGDGGLVFLEALLPVLKQEGGECHWYDFCSDQEFPTCQRTRTLLETTCARHGLAVQILHVAKVGSIAMRQLRVCVDFRVSPLR